MDEAILIKSINENYWCDIDNFFLEHDKDRYSKFRYLRQAGRVQMISPVMGYYHPEVILTSFTYNKFCTVQLSKPWHEDHGPNHTSSSLGSFIISQAEIFLFCSFFTCKKLILKILWWYLDLPWSKLHNMFLFTRV